MIGLENQEPIRMLINLEVQVNATKSKLRLNRCLRFSNS